MSFDPKHFKDLAGAEEGNYWFVNRNALILWALKRYAASTRKFLEVGCGTGFVLAAVSKAFPAADITATEMYAEGLEFAKTRVPMATFQQADAKQLAFENTFDVVGSFDVIEHIDNDELVLQNFYTALKPQGCLVVTVPQHRFLWSAADEIAHHQRRYSRKELVQKVEQAGFEVIKVTSFVTLLFPLMVLSRMKNKKNKNFSVADEMHISSWLNKLLFAVLTIERLFIEYGITFPFGGSLLLVAKKSIKA
jgi:trans-aconitate methyltransferase